MGLAFALGFAVLAMAALVLSRRLTRSACIIVGAALLIALAGYAWQGNPDMAGTPVSHQV
ncbi:MAG: hypothetical protein ABIM50_14920 [Novosphingobium sp.]